MKHDLDGRLSRLRWLLVSGFLLASGCGEAAYRHMSDPSRDAWQHPREVVAHLQLRPGDRVADLGAGSGYFTWHLAEAVGQRGSVYAVEIDETALRLLAEGLRSRGLDNVHLVRGEPSDARLPEPVDLVFSCDTYHHMDDRAAYFQSLRRSLTPQGRVAILDFHSRGFFSGLLGHGTPPDVVRREMEQAGYRLIAAHDLVQSQHFQIFAIVPP
jgi:ubiquinone/menaquinone biosynthesis C-methylase UbiE